MSALIVPQSIAKIAKVVFLSSIKSFITTTSVENPFNIPSLNAITGVNVLSKKNSTIDRRHENTIDVRIFSFNVKNLITLLDACMNTPKAPPIIIYPNNPSRTDTPENKVDSTQNIKILTQTK